MLDKTGNIKLCDFGISGQLIDSIAKTRDAGCRPYMAVCLLSANCVEKISFALLALKIERNFHEFVYLGVYLELLFVTVVLPEGNIFWHLSELCLYFSSDIFRCFILSVCITACTSVTCLLNINQSIK